MDAMTKPLLGGSERTFRALLRAMGLLRREMEPFFARFGISGAQWGMLRTLLRAEREGQAALRLTDMGKRLLIRPPSVTVVVDRLRRLGLVERTASATDHRSKHVSLTAAGRGVVELIEHQRAGQIEKLLGGLAPQEQEHLCRLLERLTDHLESLPGRKNETLAT
jgi:DNA-binding MarR family transcriptional regulator